MMTLTLHARRNFVSILRRMVFIVGLLALGASLGLALGSGLYAADLAVVPVHSGSKPHSSLKDTSRINSGTPLEEFAKGENAACTAWTDGCRTCGKGREGVFCSNVGIACQPSEPHCTRGRPE
jgi:hypothetical protein